MQLFETMNSMQAGADRDDWDTYLLADEVLDAMGCLAPGRPRQSLLRFFRRVAAKSAAVMLPAAAVPKRCAEHWPDILLRPVD